MLNSTSQAPPPPAPPADDSSEPGPSTADADPPQPPPTDFEIITSPRLHARAINVHWLRAHLLQALPHLHHPVARLSIRLLDDDEITALNARFHNQNHATDVLTFPTHIPGEPIELDVAIGVDQAARLAAEHHHTLERELLLYALHALLHGCGMDDHTDADFAAIHAREDAILAAIGVGPTFTPKPSPPAAPGDRA